MRIDIKLLYTMAQERSLQINTLQGWVIMMGIALFLQSVTFIFFVVIVWR